MPKRLVISILVIFIVVFLLLDVAIYGFVVYKNFLLPKPSNTAKNALVLPTVALNDYKDSATGVTFQYPDSLAYASFQVPKLVITVPGENSIDSKGCLPAQGSNVSDSIIAMNGMSFCLSSGSQKISQVIIYTYNYTILKNTPRSTSKNYYTLEYTVATLAGCNSFAGSPQYQYCIDSLKNYNSTVVPLIQKSVSSLKFPN